MLGLNNARHRPLLLAFPRSSRSSSGDSVRPRKWSLVRGTEAATRCRRSREATVTCKVDSSSNGAAVSPLHRRCSDARRERLVSRLEMAVTPRSPMRLQLRSSRAMRGGSANAISTAPSAPMALSPSVNDSSVRGIAPARIAAPLSPIPQPHKSSIVSDRANLKGRKCKTRSGSKRPIKQCRKCKTRSCSKRATSCSMSAAHTTPRLWHESAWIVPKDDRSRHKWSSLSPDGRTARTSGMAAEPRASQTRRPSRVRAMLRQSLRPRSPSRRSSASTDALRRFSHRSSRSRSPPCARPAQPRMCKERIVGKLQARRITSLSPGRAQLPRASRSK